MCARSSSLASERTTLGQGEGSGESVVGIPPRDDAADL